jgi:hypothetical protein
VSVDISEDNTERMRHGALYVFINSIRDGGSENRFPWSKICPKETVLFSLLLAHRQTHTHPHTQTHTGHAKQSSKKYKERVPSVHLRVERLRRRKRLGSLSLFRTSNTTTAEIRRQHD